MPAPRTISNERRGDAEIVTTLDADHVGTITFSRPPSNFFDVELIAAIGDALDELARQGARAAVLASVGKHFCAGAKLSPAGSSTLDAAQQLYAQGLRIFAQPLPVIAAVQGAATGGGVGLALACDFRVATPETRFWVNFARLGFHAGFGLSVTLPWVLGNQHAAQLLYSGRVTRGAEAHSIGLCDRLATADDLLGQAHELAAEIAQAAPLAVQSMRATHRRGLLAAVREAVVHEAAEQARLRVTADWAEGVSALAERREPQFRGE